MPVNPDGSISIHTLGDFIAAGYDYSVTCSDCGRHSNLNLEALSKKLGEIIARWLAIYRSGFDAKNAAVSV